MKIKYPRTPHLPWSPGVTSDDIKKVDLSSFENKEIVVTEKMDGENTTLYSDYIHARSIDSRYHPSRDWVKALQARIAYKIPVDWRVCGENLYAKHSIVYNELPSYFLAFSVWNENNECLSWDESQKFFNELGLESPKVLYRGPWCQKTLENLKLNTASQEGYVVRIAESFHYSEFNKSVAKWVRKDHVAKETHWMHSEVIPNKLAKKTKG